MSETTARRARPTVRLEVVRTEQLTPHMVRVVAGGPGFADFVANGYTDAYVKLVLPRPDVTYPEPFDMAEVRATMPREQWPAIRTYTVRWVDEAAGEIAIDVVQHGDSGLAGPWAARVRPGDRVLLNGPGGAYAPRADVDAHVLAGDEAALPAIAAALESVGPGVPVHAVIEVDGPADELALTCPGEPTVTWVHRGRGDDLVAAVRALAWPAGRVQAFVHGETGAVKQLRAHLLDERGVDRDLLSISGYWRRGADEDRFQAEKRAAA